MSLVQYSMFNRPGRVGNVAGIKQAKNKSRGSHCGLFYGFFDCPSQNNQGNVNKACL